MTTQDKKKLLQPFRLAPFLSPRIWGFTDLSPWFDIQSPDEPIGEAWLTGDDSKVETGALAGKTLAEVSAEYRGALMGEDYVADTFPLLIKVLFPKEKLSVQVHPDDAMAQKYGDLRGKTECWYALDAQPGAAVALGMKPGAGQEEIRAAIADETLEDLVNLVPVEKQDMIFVDAGTVHAIGPGVVLLETQQNSDLTYRMYDYGRPRELHIDRSLEAIRTKTRAGKIAPVAENGHVKLIDVPYFRVDRFELSAADGKGKLSSGAGDFSDRAKIFFVSAGEATVHSKGAEPLTLDRCQIAIVPFATSEWSVTTSDEAEVIRIVPQPGPQAGPQ